MPLAKEPRALQHCDVLRPVGLEAASKLLIHEPVAYSGDSDEVGRTYDLILLAMGGGCARSEEQFHVLLAGAGLRMNKVIPTPMFPLIEAVPAD